MCRHEIPANFIERPQLIQVEESPKENTEEENQWYYEGRNGNILLPY